MLTRYTLTLTPTVPCSPRCDWAYRLYAALLEQAPQEMGDSAHEDAVTPLSQCLVPQGGYVRWTVNLLGRKSETALGPVLAASDSFHLLRDNVTFQVTGRQMDTVRRVDDLLLAGAAHPGVHSLRLLTPTAFRSRGKYINLPTSRLILQSLIKKWNGCFPECPIEDDDGQGMDALAEGVKYGRFRLSDSNYRLKGALIPGFVGNLVIENTLTGFHRDLLSALLLFSGFSGIGIKTALGMGGVEIN